MRKFEMGTPECGLAFGILGALIALLILFLGLWRTLFIAVLFALGYFIGAVANKGEAIKTVVNKVFPPKDE